LIVFELVFSAEKTGGLCGIGRGSSKQLKLFGGASLGHLALLKATRVLFDLPRVYEHLDGNFPNNDALAKGCITASRRAG
jgi:hypothetical protein